MCRQAHYRRGRNWRDPWAIPCISRVKQLIWMDTAPPFTERLHPEREPRDRFFSNGKKAPIRYIWSAEKSTWTVDGTNVDNVVNMSQHSETFARRCASVGARVGHHAHPTNTPSVRTKQECWP